MKTVNTYSTTNFHYEGNNQFSQELSTLRAINFEFEPVTLDKNTHKLGFSMTNEKTGVTVVFALEKTVKNDGDLQYMEFKGATPGYEHLMVTIFND